MVDSKDKCEAAASYLGLSDTSARTQQVDPRPYGCIYGQMGQRDDMDDYLSWYSPILSPYDSGECGYYNCICQTKDINSYSSSDKETILLDLLNGFDF